MMKRNVFCAVALNIVIATSALAFTIPAPDSFMYAVYDTLMNGILCGPLGFVLALFCIAFGWRQFIHYNYAAPGPPYFGLSTYVPISGIVWFLVAAFLLHADTWMVSLGAVI